MRLLIISLLMTINFGLFSQSLRIDFIGQGNKDEVKLLWRPIYWPENVQGFNIKRRANNTGSWVTINKELIAPSITSVDKTSNNADEVNRLISKRDSLIAAGNIRDTSPESIKSSFLNDSSGIKFLNLLINTDYDYALMFGFGFYDKNLPDARSYTYGLFPVIGNDEQSAPINTFTWEYDTEPDLMVEFQYDIEKLRKKRGVQLKWLFDNADLNSKNIKGFHIFMEDSLGKISRLTNLARKPTKGEESAKPVLIYVNQEYDLSKDARFYAKPVDIFNTIGAEHSIKYSEEDFALLEAPILSKASTEKGVNSVEVSWSFNSLNEQKILSFEIYRRKSIDDPALLIGETSVQQRQYVDNDLPEDGYFLYTVAAITPSYQKLESNEVLTLVDSQPVVTAPADLRGQVIDISGKKYIRLKWDAPIEGYPAGGYQLYVDAFNSGEVARQSSLPPIRSTIYDYEVYNRFGKKYDFAVSAIDENGTESQLSKTISVYIPSKSLPTVNIWPIGQEDNVVTLNWKYSEDIDDLAGFRLYQNGELIKTEKDLPAEAREWKSSNLEPGNYTYVIQAVSKFDVESQKSQPRNFIIKAGN